MALIDLILNLAGLLLWLNWRSVRFDPLGKRTPATLDWHASAGRAAAFAAMAFAGGAGRAVAAARGALLADRFGGGWAAGKLESGHHRTLVPQRFFRAHAAVFHFQLRVDARRVLSLAAAAFHPGRAGTPALSSAGANAPGRNDRWARG
jgi:hypothetical protein